MDALHWLALARETSSGKPVQCVQLYKNDLLMSVLYPGVSHLFPFRTEK